MAVKAEELRYVVELEPDDITKREDDDRETRSSRWTSSSPSSGPLPAGNGPGELPGEGGDCFVGASLHVEPADRWTVNGAVIGR